MMVMKNWMAALSVIILLPLSASADEIRYRPVNPAFGGNPFNGQYLLSNATSQRQFSAPTKKKDPVEEFSATIQQSLLSRIAREISDQILGENAKDSGTFSVGGTTVQFQKNGATVQVQIDDMTSGGHTTIEIPTPQY